MKTKIIIYSLISLFLYSCASATFEKKGNYFSGDTYHWLRVEIISGNDIKIKENNGGVLSSCIGTYKMTSKNEIVVNCSDSRGDNINKGSITNIIPPEFNVKGEVIKIKKDKIIYRGIVLKKVP